MAPPRIRATSVSISTHAPRELADFYGRLLDAEVAVSEGPRQGEPASAGWAQIRAAEGSVAMTLNFEWDEHYAPPVWPTPHAAAPGAAGSGGASGTRRPQQAMAHLDLWVDDLDEAQVWAIECGATTHAHQPQETVRVMLDPHGHPFCLFVG
ncbi:VOC family protein [Ornithinimicrobium faecis]|uniref:VOC family protein n=1 Tax=Ornithinimicrobium faecis TaxID=2934158 RepID=A0ABY4YUA7_9MICO|nr:VOC family protein [Ornithinimicrobium sp. HY1793]USQ80353.1 VOC family protein [Ornithinimicrobium sp. HY1793]